MGKWLVKLNWYPDVGKDDLHEMTVEVFYA